MATDSCPIVLLKIFGSMFVSIYVQQNNDGLISEGKTFFTIHFTSVCTEKYQYCITCSGAFISQKYFVTVLQFLVITTGTNKPL
jgi:hypothetical protein